MSNIKMADYSIDQTIRADATVRYGTMTGNMTAISLLRYSAVSIKNLRQYKYGDLKTMIIYLLLFPY